MCGGFTEMLLSRHTRILCPGLSGLCCPVLVRRQIASENGTCRRGARLSRESAALQAGPTCGACGVFVSEISPHRLARGDPGPIPGVSSKKGRVVSETQHSQESVSRHASKGYLVFHKAGAWASGRRPHCSVSARQRLLGH